VRAERDELMRDIAIIEQWWRDPRWKGTKRTYSGKG
jgi:isocitrate lyase